MNGHEGMKRTLIILIILMFLASGFTLIGASFSSFGHNLSEKQSVSSGTHSGGSLKINTSYNGSLETNSAVNINELYSSEPAPMGIADYGITQSGSAYKYNTTSFTGEVNLTDLSTYSSSSSIQCCRNTMTFQLNLNMKFTDGGNTYVYWAQDVMFYNTSSNKVVFLDNIWNLSNRCKTLQPNSVLGNGTCSADNNMSYYYDCSLPSLSNQLAEKVPGKFFMRINVTTYNDQPHLVFMYMFDHPWVAYDNVTFPFVHNLSSKPVFCVDGYNYEPDTYSFYDAELIMGGPGNGSKTMNLGSSLSLSLDFWNGHNYEAIPNAYNFGSDTAEGITNTVASFKTVHNDGNLYSYVTEGSGNLGMLYSSENVGTLNFFSVIPSGYLKIGNTEHFFEGGEAILALAPGNYSLSLLDTAGNKLCNKSIDMEAGRTVLYAQSGIYIETFKMSNLPVGDTWYVNFTDGSQSGPIHGDSYEIALQNGTYYYSIISANRQYHSIQGTFKVNGTNSEITKTFTEVKYDLNITATGLPGNVTWGVSLNGTDYDSFNSVLSISLANGTYHFVVLVPQYFTSSMGHFNVTIYGMNQNMSLTFKENKTSSSSFSIVNIIFIVIVISVVSIVVFVLRRR